MMILALVRNYIPSYEWVVKKGWNIADCVARSYDVEGMTRRHRRGRPHRPGRAEAAEAVRRASCTTPIGIGCPKQSRRNWT